jgi:hypothetical protein
VQDYFKKEKQMSLPIITNSNPPTVGIFDRYWITNLTIARGERMMIQLSPYDGTTILADNQKKERYIIADETELQPIISTIINLIKIKAEKTEDPKAITITAPSPSKPVNATAIFDTAFVQRDIFNMMNTDLDLATVVVGLLNWIANKE